METYAQAWATQFPKFLVSSEEDALALQEAGEAMLRQFYRREQRVGAPLFSEASFEIPWHSGIVLVGRIDRVEQSSDGLIRVLDYKSSQKNLEVLPLPEESLQLALYAMGTRTLLGRYPDEIGFYYLAHDAVVTIPWEQRLETMFWEAFQPLADALQAQSFVPDPEPHKCSKCPYQPKCPAFHPDLTL